MYKQSIIATLLEGIDKRNCEVKAISLVCNEQNLRERLKRDIVAGLRTEDVLAASISKLPLYQNLNTSKIETGGRTVHEIVSEIIVKK